MTTTTANVYEYLIRGTQEQIDRLDPSLHPLKCHAGDNGVTAFYYEGPDILETVQMIIEKKYPELKDVTPKNWDQLREPVQDLVISLAAGSIDWAMDSRLNHEYSLEELEMSSEYSQGEFYQL